MGGSPQPFLVSLDHFLGNKGIIRRRQRVAAGIKGRHIKISKRSRRILMKRRSTRRAATGLEGSRRPSNEVERKVRTLKKLVPNSNDTMGLDGLFRETAGYILALEMRVKVMQVMVKVLSTASDDDNDDDDE